MAIWSGVLGLPVPPSWPVLGDCGGWEGRIYSPWGHQYSSWSVGTFWTTSGCAWSPFCPIWTQQSSSLELNDPESLMCQCHSRIGASTMSPVNGVNVANDPHFLQTAAAWPGRFPQPLGSVTNWSENHTGNRLTQVRLKEKKKKVRMKWKYELLVLCKESHKEKDYQMSEKNCTTYNITWNGVVKAVTTSAWQYNNPVPTMSWATTITSTTTITTMTVWQPH